MNVRWLLSIFSLQLVAIIAEPAELFKYSRIAQAVAHDGELPIDVGYYEILGHAFLEAGLPAQTYQVIQILVGSQQPPRFPELLEQQVYHVIMSLVRRGGFETSAKELDRGKGKGKEKRSLSGEPIAGQVPSIRRPEFKHHEKFPYQEISSALLLGQYQVAKDCFFRLVNRIHKRITDPDSDPDWEKVAEILEKIRLVFSILEFTATHPDNYVPLWDTEWNIGVEGKLALLDTLYQLEMATFEGNAAKIKNLFDNVSLAVATPDRLQDIRLRLSTIARVFENREAVLSHEDQHGITKASILAYLQFSPPALRRQSLDIMIKEKGAFLSAAEAAHLASLDKHLLNEPAIHSFSTLLHHSISPSLIEIDIGHDEGYWCHRRPVDYPSQPGWLKRFFSKEKWIMPHFRGIILDSQGSDDAELTDGGISQVATIYNYPGKAVGNGLPGFSEIISHTSSTVRSESAGGSAYSASSIMNIGELLVSSMDDGQVSESSDASPVEREVAEEPLNTPAKQRAIDRGIIATGRMEIGNQDFVPVVGQFQNTKWPINLAPSSVLVSASELGIGVTTVGSLSYPATKLDDYPGLEGEQIERDKFFDSIRDAGMDSGASSPQELEDSNITVDPSDILLLKERLLLNNALMVIEAQDEARRSVSQDVSDTGSSIASQSASAVSISDSFVRPEGIYARRGKSRSLGSTPPSQQQSQPQKRRQTIPIHRPRGTNDWLRLDIHPPDRLKYLAPGVVYIPRIHGKSYVEASTTRHGRQSPQREKRRQSKDKRPNKKRRRTIV